MSSSLPLRIAVLGAGRIGSAFAFQLVRAGGHDVTVIARPGSVRLAQLERDQAIVDHKGERASVAVAGGLDETTPYDLVIVTLLAHQVEPLLPLLKRSAARCIQFMFNTFDALLLQSAIGVERCAFGMPFVQSNLDADGKLKVSIGAGGQKTLMDQQRWVDVFNAAGLPAALEPGYAALAALPHTALRGVRKCVRGGCPAWRRRFVGRSGRACPWRPRKLRTHQGYWETRSTRSAKKRLDAEPAIWVVAAILWGMSRIPLVPRTMLATGRAECISAGGHHGSCRAARRRQKPSFREHHWR